MFISVVICTIRRTELIRTVLDSLAAQSYRDFEVLLVGSEHAQPREPAFAISGAGLLFNGTHPIRWLPAPHGLAAARNVGLRHAEGDVICFLDDDVSLPESFLADAAALLRHPDLQDVGGLTGYDTVNYPQPVTLRWRLRYWLGIAPSLRPGDADHLGRNVPISFFEPFSGVRPVGWLPGFCQIYRSAAVQGLRCDEEIIGGEDRDLSMQVGQRWRLMISGDLRLEHCQDVQGRFPSLRQLWRVAFGMGRSLGKGQRSPADRLTLVRYLAGELAIDVLAFLRHPSGQTLRVAVTRQRGYIAGLRSLSASRPVRAEFRGLPVQACAPTDER